MLTGKWTKPVLDSAISSKQKKIQEVQQQQVEAEKKLQEFQQVVKEFEAKLRQSKGAETTAEREEWAYRKEEAEGEVLYWKEVKKNVAEDLQDLEQRLKRFTEKLPTVETRNPPT